MSPLYLALDIAQRDQALEFAERMRSYVGGYKLGLEYFVANGPAGVHEIAKLGLPIFLDLKLHDIPNTVSMAIQAMHALEPSIITVHAAGGRSMLEDAKAAAPSNCKVVAVTVLTSLDATDMQECGIAGNAEEQTVRLAELAQKSGLDGIVCSGQDLKAVREIWARGFFVVPGVRLPKAPQAPQAETDDQKRIITPRQAMDDGASVLVVGRSVSQAEQPEETIRAIKASI